MITRSSLIASHDKLRKSLTGNHVDDLHLMIKYKVKCINAWKYAIKYNQEEANDFKILVENILNEMKMCCDDAHKYKNIVK